MTPSEAEVQVLASLRGAELEAQPTDRASLNKRGGRHWIFLEDWSDAFSSLAKQGLIEGGEAGYRLTDAGRPLGDAYHRERPDMYWYHYQRLYPAAPMQAPPIRAFANAFMAETCARKA